MIGETSPAELYCAMLRDPSAVMVLDARSVACFEMGRVAGSIRIEVARLAADLMWPLRQSRFRSLLHVLGGNISLASKTARTSRFVVVREESGGDGDNGWIARLSAIPDVSVSVLTGGFGAWRQRYPFLCDPDEEGAENDDADDDDELPSEVLDDFLFLGGIGCTSAKTLQRLKITHVVSVCHDFVGCHQGVRYLRCPVFDSPSEDIARHFPAAFRFINEARRAEGGRVLVHCVMGVSRSATIVAGYLMQTSGISVDAALSAVDARRPIAPNEGFIQQLAELDETAQRDGLRPRRSLLAMATHRSSTSAAASKLPPALPPPQLSLME